MYYKPPKLPIYKSSVWDRADTDGVSGYLNHLNGGLGQDDVTSHEIDTMIKLNENRRNRRHDRDAIGEVDRRRSFGRQRP